MLGLRIFFAGKYEPGPYHAVPNYHVFDGLRWETQTWRLIARGWRFRLGRRWRSSSAKGRKLAWVMTNYSGYPIFRMNSGQRGSLRSLRKNLEVFTSAIPESRSVYPTSIHSKA